MAGLDDPRLVAQQYGDARRLDGRIALYRRYDRSPQSWPRWVFDRLRLRPGERVVEFGAGPGELWRTNRDRLPRGLRVTLTDASEGMLAAARERLEGLDFAYERQDVQAATVADASADVAIAQHMLYHVPDRAAAVATLRRVLAPDGRCYVGTNDWTHLIELRALIARFGIPTAMRPVGRDPDFFDLEAAARELEPRFTRLRLHRRRVRLEVTDAGDLLAYVATMTPVGEVPEAGLDALREHAEWLIARLGSVSIGVAAGTFEARP